MRYLRRYIIVPGDFSLRINKHVVTQLINVGIKVYHRVYYIFFGKKVVFCTSFQFGGAYISFEHIENLLHVHTRAYTIDDVPTGLQQLNCRKSYELSDDFCKFS